MGQVVRLCERLVAEAVWAAEGTAARAPAVIVEVNCAFISTLSAFFCFLMNLTALRVRDAAQCWQLD